MPLEFTFHGTVRGAAGRDRPERDIDLPTGTTVGDALRAVLSDISGVEPLVLDSKGRLRAHAALERNGDDVRAGEWLETPVADGDGMDRAPSVEGAC